MRPVRLTWRRAFSRGSAHGGRFRLNSHKEDALVLSVGCSNEASIWSQQKTAGEALAGAKDEEAVGGGEARAEFSLEEFQRGHLGGRQRYGMRALKHYLGTFDAEEDAARAFDLAVQRFEGKCSRREISPELSHTKRSMWHVEGRKVSTCHTGLSMQSTTTGTYWRQLALQVP